MPVSINKYECVSGLCLTVKTKIYSVDRKINMHIVNKCHSGINRRIDGLHHLQACTCTHKSLWANLMLFTDLCVCSNLCAVFSVGYLKRVTTD